MRRWLGIGITGILLIALLGSTACTRSKMGPAPTSAAQGTPIATIAAQTTPAAGKTVVAVVTATGSPTAIPSMTSTVAPTATSTPTPTPVLTVQPTATPSPSEFVYIVRTGDTLWGLAARFGTTVEAIKARNGLTSDIIYADQELYIPGSDPGSGQTITHVVQPGENLYRIALKYGTTPAAIAAANNIVNPNMIYAGQKLIISTGTMPPGTGTRYHVVQPGESLWSIALRYGTTPWKIAAANGISNIHYIYAGQTLRIP
jgi:LysM repeat protein